MWQCGVVNVTHYLFESRTVAFLWCTSRLASSCHLVANNQITTHHIVSNLFTSHRVASRVVTSQRIERLGKESTLSIYSHVTCHYVSSLHVQSQGFTSHFYSGPGRRDAPPTVPLSFIDLRSVSRRASGTFTWTQFEKKTTYTTWAHQLFERTAFATFFDDQSVTCANCRIEVRTYFSVYNKIWLGEKHGKTWVFEKKRK